MTNIVLNWEFSWLQRSKWMTNLLLSVCVHSREVSSWQRSAIKWGSSEFYLLAWHPTWLSILIYLGVPNSDSFWMPKTHLVWNPRKNQCRSAMKSIVEPGMACDDVTWDHQMWRHDVVPGACHATWRHSPCWCFMTLSPAWIGVGVISCIRSHYNQNYIDDKIEAF
jgi:hypothetical protein